MSAQLIQMGKFRNLQRSTGNVINRMCTHENVTEFCLTREINFIFNKTTLTILYVYNGKNQVANKVSHKSKWCYGHFCHFSVKRKCFQLSPLEEKLFFPTNFPTIFQSCSCAICFVLQFNGGNQVEMKMIDKNNLVPDMRCLLIISPKSCLLFI